MTAQDLYWDERGDKIVTNLPTAQQCLYWNDLGPIRTVVMAPAPSPTLRLLACLGVGK